MCGSGNVNFPVKCSCYCELQIKQLLLVISEANVTRSKLDMFRKHGNQATTRNGEEKEAMEGTSRNLCMKGH